MPACASIAVCGLQRPKLSSGAAETEGEVVLVDGVYLNDESMTQISRLFKVQ